MNDTIEANIRRLIRRKGTRDYFNGEGWTQNPAEAMNFCDSLEAAQTCAARGLVDVELALIVEGQQHHDMFCTSIR
jgi:formate-dependent nitrite reductase cytochrome c552 subunit